MAVPIDDDVRLSPPLRRCHQLCCRLPACRSLSSGCCRFMTGAVIAVSPNLVMTMTPEEMVARVLYRDGLMLVLDKPAGFAVHHGPKGGESLEDHFGALRFGLPRAPALAHRLDRDTSGCLVLGRHRKALAALGRLFKAGQGRQDLLGAGGGRTGRGRGPHRPAARPPRRHPRLVDEAGPAGAAGRHGVAGAGTRDARCHRASAGSQTALGPPLMGRSTWRCACRGWLGMGVIRHASMQNDDPPP